MLPKMTIREVQNIPFQKLVKGQMSANKYSIYHIRVISHIELQQNT